MPKRGDFGVALHDINFSVRAGEIFGIAGVAGNGQNELLEVLGGEISSHDANAVLLDGKALGHMGPSDRRQLGLCSVPEERNGHAAVGEFNLTENALLTARQRKKIVNNGMIDAGKASGFAASVIESFKVKALGPQSLAGSLSGGNLQKFIMGREILQSPDVLVVSQPTWGVDAGAASAIRQAIVDLAAKGSAIVVISQDLDELLDLSDTMSVINLGRLSQPQKVGTVSIDDIGLLMGGVHGEAAHAH